MCDQIADRTLDELFKRDPHCATDQVHIFGEVATAACVDFRPAAIIARFGLTQPIFSQVSCYGHFGSNAARMPWEQTDLAAALTQQI